jgi:nitroreductase
MSVVSPLAVIEQLRWRYAVKKFDPTKKIPADTWAALEQALILAPSSFGLQPWQFFVVTKTALREHHRGAAWNQAQIVEASHLVVFCSKINLNAADVDRYVARVAEVRQAAIASLAGYRKMMVGFVEKPGFLIDQWCDLQTYIAHGQFLVAAALMGVDTCPMEGFEPEKFDAILGLKARGYASRVLATAGYRAADDAAAVLPKVRYDAKDIIDHR